MSHVVALLRAVNLPSHQKVSSAQLKAFAGALGFEDARTLITSGNLLFRDPGKPPAALEKLLERESAKRLGLKTDFHVRDAGALEEVIAANPFPKAARDDPSHLVLLFLKHAPGAAAVKALRGAIVGREQVEAHGHHAYIHYPDGIGRSKLTPRLLDKHLGAGGTGRNWNTVQKLLELAQAG